MYSGRGKYGKNWMRQAAGTVGGLLKRKKFGSDLYDVTAGAALKEMEFANSLTPAGMAGIIQGGGMYTGSGMYTGYGAYAGPDANSLLSTKSTMDVVPRFSEDTDNGVLVSRREYVSEIYAPPLVTATTCAPFTIQTFPINPGLERTFPWLSQQSVNYDEYELIQCCFTFKSTTTESGNQVNGQVGTVIMTTNYNSASAPFSEKFTMMQYDGGVSTRLTESLQHFVECDPNKLSGSKGEYIRANPVVSNQDLKTYDHGLFQIAIANCSFTLANFSLGELWVSYTVRLRKPKFFSGLGFAISKDIFISNPTGSEAVGTANFLGTNTLRGQQNNIGCLVAVNTLGTQISVTFPAPYSGYLKILMNIDGTGITGTLAAPDVISGNITLYKDFYGPGPGAASDLPDFYVYSPNGGTLANTGLMLEFHVKVDIATNGVDNAVRIYTPTVIASINQVYIEINEYNAGFSYKANNIGTSVAPIWVTKEGVVTVV